ANQRRTVGEPSLPKEVNELLPTELLQRAVGEVHVTLEPLPAELRVLTNLLLPPSVRLQPLGLECVCDLLLRLEICVHDLLRLCAVEGDLLGDALEGCDQLRVCTLRELDFEVLLGVRRGVADSVGRLVNRLVNRLVGRLVGRLSFTVTAENSRRIVGALR